MPTLVFPAGPTFPVFGGAPSISAMLDINGGCALPCLWGLVPGATDWQFLHEFNSRVETAASAEGAYFHVSEASTKEGATSIVLISGESRLNASADYRMSQGRVQSIVASFSAGREQRVGSEVVEARATYGDPEYIQQFRAYLLASVLRQHGVPAQVLVQPIQYDRHSEDLIKIALVYPASRFFIEYTLPKEVRGNDFVGCPSQVGEISIVAWSSQPELQMQDIARLNLGLPTQESLADYYNPLPLEEAASITLDEFYEIFVNDTGRNCLATPSALWPYP